MSPALDICGCTPSTAGEPRIENRPGLEALAYRIGTHPEVLRRMLRSLPTLGAGNGLGRLTTRDLDDPSIGILDAFAAVADVLSFYQERIANEGFLRTATERRSLLELARAIGYELAPGVAASTWLQFVVEDAAGGAPQPDPASLPPSEAYVPAGTRVKSLPSGGQLPQSFETSTELTARPELNRLRPRLSRPRQIEPGDEELYLGGTATGLEVGDLMLLYAGGDPQVKRVFAVEPQQELDRTRIQFTPEAPTPVLAEPILSAGLGSVSLDYIPMTGSSVSSVVSNSVWSDQTLGVMLAIQQWPVDQMLNFFWYQVPQEPPLPTATAGAYAFRQQAASFGHNAPKHKTLPTSLRIGQMEPTPPASSGGDPGESWVTGPYTEDWDTTRPDVFHDSQGNALPSPPAHAVDTVYLDAPYPKVAAHSWVLLVAGGEESTAEAYRVVEASEISQADYGMSAKVTRLRLQDVDGNAPIADDRQKFRFRDTAVHIQSEQLALAPVPLPDVLNEQPDTAPEATIELDTMVLGWEVGQPLAFTGERADMPGAYVTDVVELTAATHYDGFTRLEFTPLEHSFLRKTVTISANVVHATHGETVAHEVLGSSNGGANQRFTLRTKPLTHVSSSSPTGTDTTLEVRVDGVRWDEAPSLYGLGPLDRRYIVRRDDDGTTHVVFGDGVQGARPPSGVENVTAAYRKGIGKPGLVAARKLTLLETRPLGIREVVNPSAPTGAEDPEDRNAARRNAPFTVITLDRVVSLTDYEDFARTFAGIGKASASALWEGERQSVHVTVAGVDGAEVAKDSDTFTNLVKAIERAQDPGRKFSVHAFKRVYFQIVANALIDEAREPADVLAAVSAALADRFSFARWEFGQSVSEADVIETIMGVPGVLDTEVTGLAEIVGSTPPANPGKETLLPSRLAGWKGEEGGAVEPAQLLLLNPAGPIVTERST